MRVPVERPCSSQWKMLGRDGQLRGRPGRGEEVPPIAVSVDGGRAGCSSTGAGRKRAVSPPPNDVQSFASTFLLFPFSCSGQLPPVPSVPTPSANSNNKSANPSPPRGPSFPIHSPPLPSFSHPFDEKYTKQIKKARLLRFPSLCSPHLLPLFLPPTSHLPPSSALRPAASLLPRLRHSSVVARPLEVLSLLLVNRTQQ